MTFKQMLEDDMAVFFNLNEFAETATYEGEDVPVVEDGGFIGSTGTPGAVLPSVSIMVRASDVPAPRTGDKVTLRGVAYRVGPAPSHDGGVWTLTLDRETRTVGI